MDIAHLAYHGEDINLKNIPKSLIIFSSTLRINVFSLLLICVCFLNTSFATPPEMVPMWNKPLLAYVVFPAGRQPDDKGQFEIEIFCEAAYDIDWLSLRVNFTEEIKFDSDPPYFEGSLKKGEQKFWRVKGMLSNVASKDDLGLPAVINLTVKYRFPYESILKELEKRTGQNISYAKQKIKESKDKIKTIRQVLFVERYIERKED